MTSFILANPGNNIRINVTEKLSIHEKMTSTNENDFMQSNPAS